MAYSLQTSSITNLNVEDHGVNSATINAPETLVEGELQGKSEEFILSLVERSEPV